MNKNQAKGEIKKGAGKMVANESLEAEGHIERAAGRAQSAYGDLKNAIDKKSRTITPATLAMPGEGQSPYAHHGTIRRRHDRRHNPSRTTELNRLI